MPRRLTPAEIASRAAVFGLDPDAVMRVAAGEGLGGGIGDAGHAFGPFQLNNAGGVITRGVDREWRDLGQVSFRVEGPVVTLAWPTAEVRCVSQLMLGGRR